MSKENRPKEMSDIEEDLSSIEKVFTAIYKAVDTVLPLTMGERGQFTPIDYARSCLIENIADLEPHIRDVYIQHFGRMNIKRRGLTERTHRGNK